MGGFRDRGWRLVGLGVEMGGFRDQGVETVRFRGGRWGVLGIRGSRRVGLGVEMGWVVLGIREGVEMGGFRDQGVKTGRFRGGDGWF